MNCPACGAKDIITIYRDQDGEIFGCEECVKETYAIDYEIAMAERSMSDYDGVRDERAYGDICTPAARRM